MIKMTGSERIFDKVNICFMMFVVLVVIFPLLNVVSGSLISGEEAMERFVLFPHKINFGAYKLLFNSQSLLINGYKITIFRVVASTVLTLLVTYFLAYVLTKKDFPFRKQLTVYIFFTMFFSGGLIPTYILFRYLHLNNNIWVYVLPGLVSAYYILLMRNFIMEIPDTLVESAYIDGSSEIGILFRIIMPLSLPAMATIALFIIVGHWNAWMDAFYYVPDESKHPVQMVLRNIVVLASMPVDSKKMNIILSEKVKPPARSVQNAAVIVTTLPVVCAYPFLQKYFIKGLVLGSVKG